ncbi:MAG: Adenosylhomocysteinase [Parcubacteria group bacterium]|nr:Adenosylhomocysteinase [Parcubacteria group bacterium]
MEHRTHQGWVDVRTIVPGLQSIENEPNTHTIPLSTVRALKTIQDTSHQDVFLKSFSQGEHMVVNGEVPTPLFGSESELTYSKVPLGIITRGTVVVIKAGKGAKTLGVGDLIGLFETSDWLLTNKSRQIGDWTLIADRDCEIAFFGRAFLTDASTPNSNFRSYLIELARADHVPQPISTLPLLDWVASHTTRARLPDCAIVVHTHLLGNSFPFFRHLSHLVSPGHIYILEKPYSTIRSVFENLVRSGYDVTEVPVESGVPYEFSTKKGTEVLWKKIIENQKKYAFKKLIIVDDGGDLWLSIPWDELEGLEIVGVEQTQRGITRVEKTNHRIPPIISVASSGTKKIVESEFIGISVVKKLQEIGAITASKQIGILGVGSIGSAVERALIAAGRTALSYDPTYHTAETRGENTVSSIDVLLNRCDLIIGTVGSDSIVGTALERVSGSKVLASASSADVEFHSLLKLAEQNDDAYGTKIVSVHDGLNLKILNGGYPINFDRTVDSTPDEDIVLTRCLLYIGAMQAAYLLSIHEQTPGIYELDPLSQTRLLHEWLVYKKKLHQVAPLCEKDVDRIVSYRILADAKSTPTVWED